MTQWFSIQRSVSAENLSSMPILPASKFKSWPGTYQIRSGSHFACIQIKLSARELSNTMGVQFPDGDMLIIVTSPISAQSEKVPCRWTGRFDVRSTCTGPGSEQWFNRGDTRTGGSSSIGEWWFRYRKHILQWRWYCSRGWYRLKLLAAHVWGRHAKEGHFISRRRRPMSRQHPWCRWRRESPPVQITVSETLETVSLKGKCVLG